MHIFEDNYEMKKVHKLQKSIKPVVQLFENRYQIRYFWVFFPKRIVLENIPECKRKIR